MNNEHSFPECFFAGVTSSKTGKRMCRVTRHMTKPSQCVACVENGGEKDTVKPGVEFKKLIESLGVTLPECAACRLAILRMDDAGVVGCKLHRAKFVADIKSRLSHVPWTQYITAAANAITSGLAFSLNPLDPIGSLYDEAVRRAEKNT